MNPFIKKLFGNKLLKDNILPNIKELSILSDDINKKKKKIDEIEFEAILANKEEYFITLSDFLDMMEKENISVQDIIKLCKHISDINTKDFAYIDVYPIIDGSKIILSTEEQKEYKGDKIRIVTAKRINK
jgi:hypothetical protein